MPPKQGLAHSCFLPESATRAIYSRLKSNKSGEFAGETHVFKLLSDYMQDYLISVTSPFFLRVSPVLSVYSSSQ